MVREMRSCSVRVKKLVKVGLSEGGSVQLGLFLKGEICAMKICIGLVGRGLLLMVVCICVLMGV